MYKKSCAYLNKPFTHFSVRPAVQITNIIIITTLNTSHIVRNKGDSFRNTNINKISISIAKPLVSSDVHVSIEVHSSVIINVL
jgi:hypothetical protein